MANGDDTPWELYFLIFVFFASLLIAIVLSIIIGNKLNEDPESDVKSMKIARGFFATIVLLYVLAFFASHGIN